MSTQNTPWTLLKKYKWNSVFFRYAIILLSAIILPITLVTFFIFYEINKVNKNYYIESQIKICEEKINSQLSDIVNTVYMTQNAFFQMPSLQSYICEDDLTTNEININASQINSYLKNTCISSAYIDSIYLYCENSDYIISNIGNSFLDNFPDGELFSELGTENAESRIIHRFSNIAGNRREYITFYNNASAYGYPFCSIAYNIDCSVLPDILYSSNEFIDKIYISDQSGNILFSNDETAISQSFDRCTKHAKTVIGTQPSSSLQFAFSYNDSDSFTTGYMLIVLIYTFITLLALSISIYLVSKRYLNAFVDIINILQPNTDENESSGNEIQYLLKNIKNMVNRNSSFEKEFVAQYKKLKSFQAIILQNQINPHFIFNVMNTISLIDVKQNGHPTEITEMITALSDILRSLMNSDKYVIPFERELSYADKYLTLQNIKYNNKFNYITDIAPETEELPMLKFALQPIIENAIVHGILKLREANGDIILKSRIENEKMIIEISNTADPIPDSVIDKLNQSLDANTYPSGRHIGLMNVNTRIKLIFGESYGCHIAHRDSLTTVTLTFPTDSETS